MAATPVDDVAFKAQNNDATNDKAKEEKVAFELEPKSGVSFPVKLNDAKQLKSAGLMKKNILLTNIKIFGFGIYADNKKLKEFLKSKIRKAPEKPLTPDILREITEGSLATRLKEKESFFPFFTRRAYRHPLNLV